ncbi:phd-finger protein [Salix suchowensis]|nr:phd-finger protein [Salix suchowensis]
MSTRRSLRSQRHTQDDERDVVDDEHESDDRGENAENVDKEQMIWDSFREEHYEGHTSNLLPTLQLYIRKRREIAHSNAPENLHAESTSPGLNRKDGDTDSSSPSRRSPVSNGMEAQSTRELLSHIARLAEDLSSASEEKVNLAQAACDSIDRQIRQIDQAIKEQEVAISLGSRPGTSLAPVILPDLAAVSRWSRVTHVEISDEEGEAPLPLQDDEGMVLGVTTSAPGKRRRGRPKGQLKVTEAQGLVGAEPHRRETRSLKILPPKPPNDDEDVYCLCQGSKEDAVSQLPDSWRRRLMLTDCR